MDDFFDDLFVVEFADRRNQFVGKFLADGGAQGVQIETPAGSPGRACGPFVADVPDPDQSLDYWFYNTGKQSLCLDVETEPDREVARRLMTRADIVLESSRPGTMQRLGLDYASIAERNTRLIYASLTDFGQDGPWRDYHTNGRWESRLGGADVSVRLLRWDRDAHCSADPSVLAYCWHRLRPGSGRLAVRTDGERPRPVHRLCGTRRMCRLRGGFISLLVYGNNILLRQTGQHAALTPRPPVMLLAADGRYVNGRRRDWRRTSGQTCSHG